MPSHSTPWTLAESSDHLESFPRAKEAQKVISTSMLTDPSFSWNTRAVRVTNIWSLQPMRVVLPKSWKLPLLIRRAYELTWFQPYQCATCWLEVGLTSSPWLDQWTSVQQNASKHQRQYIQIHANTESESILWPEGNWKFYQGGTNQQHYSISCESTNRFSWKTIRNPVHWEEQKVISSDQRRHCALRLQQANHANFWFSFESSTGDQGHCFWNHTYFYYLQCWSTWASALYEALP